MSKSITIEGISGTLQVYDTKVTITPKGVFGFLLRGLL